MRKKIGFVVVIMLVLSLILAGCGAKPVEEQGESPQQAVTAALTALSSLDFETAQKYFTYEELLGEEAGELADTDESAEFFFNRLSFTVKSAAINGDSATVTTEITNIDMLSVFTEYIQQVFILALSNAFSENPMTEEELEEKFQQMFLGFLSDETNLVTTTVDIQLTKSGTSWKIAVNEELQDAILGGLVTALKESGETE